MSVCVVGAGINGLSTALEIQHNEPRSRVTIVAENCSPNVTSDIAAGLWRPAYCSDTSPTLIEKWGRTTFEKTYRLAWTEPEETGCSITSGYEFTNNRLNEDELYWSDIVHNFRHVRKREVRELGINGLDHGVFYSSTFLESSSYLPYLQKQFEQRGGTLIQRKLNSLHELEDSYDVLVNCSGLGARWLVNDTSVFPIRGQVFRVAAPFQKHFMVFGDADLIVLVNRDNVLLGSTHQKNDWDLTFRQKDADFILNGLGQYVPWVKRAKVLRRVVGLRPGRPSVRLEREQLSHADGSNKTTPVVHNYGHGGSGITLFHGCAIDTAELVHEALHRPGAKL